MSNLEPDLGESTSAAQRSPAPAPTITVTPRNPLAPRLPDELQAKIDSYQAGTIKAPAQPVDATGLDTTSIITNLPDARKSFVTKYTRLKKTVQALPEPVRKSIVQMDLDRANKGQGPMNDQETLAAIITTMRNEPATKEPEDTSILGTIAAIPGNAVTDAGNIAKALPSMLVPNRGNVLYKEAMAAGSTVADSFTGGERTDAAYKANREAGMNPWEAFWSLPGARLVPGVRTIGNLVKGEEGLREIAKTPVGTALDVLPYATKAAGMTNVGKIAAAEKEAGIASVKPLRAVLTRKVLPEGETTILGSQLAPAKLGIPTSIAADSRVGSWAQQAFGQEARAVAKTTNIYDAKFAEVLQGARPLSTVDDKVARQAFTFLAEDAPRRYGLDKPAIQKVTAALETDRNIIFDTPGFSDAERAFASRAIKLQQRFEALNVQSDDLVRIYDEVYDAKTGKSIRKAQEKLGKLSAKVDEGLATKVAGARQVLEDKIRLAEAPEPVASYDRIGATWRNNAATDAAKVDFSTLPDDALVAVFHGTTPERAAEIIKTGKVGVPEGYASDLPTKATDAMYVAPTVADAANYGDAVVELQVRKGDLTASPEARGADLATALFNSFDGAVLPKNYRPIASGRPGELPTGPVIKGKGLSTVDRHVYQKLAPLSDMLDDYFRNPDTTVTLQDLDKASRGLVAQRTRIGGAGQVGEKVAQGGDIRLDTLARIRQELKEAAKAERRLQKQVDKAPARWIPNVQLMAKDRTHQYLIGEGGLDPVEATRVIAERDFQAYPSVYNQKVMENIVRETEPVWKELKAAGIDPLYVHRVPLSKQRILSLPRLTDWVTPLTQAEKRNIYNATPYTQDVTIALAHQGAEIVAKKLSQEALDSIGRDVGVREGALRARVMPMAREMAAGSSDDINDIATKIISKDYELYNPGAFGTKLPKLLNNDERIWIPKTIAKNLDRYYHPNPGELLGAVSAVNGIFRTAVLPFSVRWQVNNTIGGAIVTAITNPGAFLKIVEARKVIKAWKEGVDGALPEEVGYGLGSIRKEIAASKYSVASYSHGERVGSLYQKIQESKLKQAGSAAAQKMYDANSFMDETFKVMTYLNKRDGALRRGAGKMAADEAGLSAVNQYFQNWNSLTPIERQLLREVFPFYAFTSYAMRFIMNYPGTHPLRASIMANMAEAEVKDMNQALPPEMMDYLAVGPMDENGDQRFLSLRGLNPFSDTADSFTLTGFLSGINPIGQAVVKSLGGDLGYGVGAGQPTYDKESGKMTDEKPGFVTSLVSSTVPQIGFLNRVLGRDAEYNALLRTNPEAAQRLLVSGVGIPASGRTINIPQTQIKNELARLQVQAQVFKRARETGDYTEAMKWPALRPQIEQLQRLNALGLLREYNPTAGAANSVTDAIGSVKPWPT